MICRRRRCIRGTATSAIPIDETAEATVASVLLRTVH
jgi:hypothetical protein